MMDGGHLCNAASDTSVSIDAVREELLSEYLQDHNWPWIVGFSGGKDSTVVAHLVFEMLLSLPPSQRQRQVHIVANDTLVESPLVVDHINETINEIKNAANAFDVPVATKITQPEPDQSFWVNLIGRGYPSPNRSFRWCTDRMKIRPTTRYIKSLADSTEKVILLLGVRRSESSARAAMVARYDSGDRLHPHSDLSDCLVFRPIVEWSIDQVWSFLTFNEPPWGGSHLKLIGLYRNASGGSECPVATSKDDIAACGSMPGRFGCWTCTLVDKDRSLEGFVEAGHDEFAPLVKFRNWLVKIRNEKGRRQLTRRNGKVTFSKEGKVIPGPFTLETRHKILSKLKKLQEKTGKCLISKEEEKRIRKIWFEEFSENKNSELASICRIGG